MDLARRIYNREWKVAAMREIDSGRTTGELARQLELRPKLLERWRGEWRARGELAFPGSGRRGPSQGFTQLQRTAELERKIGQLTMENDFLEKTFTAFQGSSPASGRQWRGCLFEEIRQAAEKGQAVRALCAMAGLSRAGYYRWRAGPPGDPVEMELRDTMQRIALEFPCHGYRRITAEMQRRGFQVNHKRVLRLMREDNLLCLRRKSFVVTTDSRHSLPVYENLTREMTPSALNQLWGGEITYIQLRREFVYLAVLLDSYSRRVVGWALGRTLRAELTLAALGMALRQRQRLPGLAHHSDRGVQYACRACTALLQQHSTRSPSA